MIEVDKCPFNVYSMFIHMGTIPFIYFFLSTYILKEPYALRSSIAFRSSLSLFITLNYTLIVHGLVGLWANDQYMNNNHK